MRKINYLTGTKFGMWTLLGDGVPRHGIRYLRCQCECGKVAEISAQSLRRGQSKSCGCYEIKHPSHLTHGLSKHAIYDLWCGMIGRCYCATNHKFPRYGGRGISVCEFLRASPANLLTLLGERPSPKLSVGRINNDGHYSCGVCSECLQRAWPLNVRWETAKQQARNTSTNRLFTIDGVTKTIAEWAESTGIASYNFTRRIDRGVNPITNSK